MSSEKQVKHIEGKLDNLKVQNDIFRQQVISLFAEHRKMIEELDKLKSMTVDEFLNWQSK